MCVSYRVVQVGARLRLSSGVIYHCLALGLYCPLSRLFWPSSKLSGWSCFMMQGYRESRPAMTERVEMGSHSIVCKGKTKKIEDGKKKEAQKALDEFDTKWEGAASRQ
jgi:hypothetical protein